MAPASGSMSRSGGKAGKKKLQSPDGTGSSWHEAANDAGDKGGAKPHDGRGAVEEDVDPIYTCADRFEVTNSAYGAMSAKARDEKIHPAAVKLPPARRTKGRTKWIGEDKKNQPYSYFESPANDIPPVTPTKPPAPPKMWLPMRGEEHRRKMASEAKTPKKEEVEAEKKKKEEEKDVYASVMAEMTGGAMSSTAKTKKVKEVQTPWDTEHHIKKSQMNHEVQVNCREYFDKPIRKEGEGIPKVLQIYSMNDRQAGWHDEPDKLGAPRRTHLSWVGAYNVGGPKEQQMPSYWRKNIGKSNPDLMLKTHTPATFAGETKSPQEQMFLERLAQMPAKDSKEFWRGWLQHSSCTNMPVRLESEGEGEDEVEKSSKKRGWSGPKPGIEPLGPDDERVQIPKEMTSRALMDNSGPKGKIKWDERWSILHSKDNKGMPGAVAEFFSPSHQLSGASKGASADKFLTSAGMKWRGLRANATSPDLKKMKVLEETYGRWQIEIK